MGGVLTQVDMRIWVEDLGLEGCMTNGRGPGRYFCETS
jgi:hypothetical protein